ncbi:MAG: hydantoinase B/oxoprolinase family protein [Gammaproteobacteria bacterium]
MLISERTETSFEFWIDRGGTFTDIVARTPEGTLVSAKYLSVAPERYADAALFGMSDMLRQRGYSSLADAPVAAIRMGTTVATNALLERDGATTALLITRGFADALLIGEQHRPDIFALDIQRPASLYHSVIEVDERVDADGSVLIKPDLDALRDALADARAQGVTSVAIALLHGYKNPLHERQCADTARDAGFDYVSMSHDVGALAKLVGRGDTTVVDAYLTPVLHRYVRAVEVGVGPRLAPTLRFMQSSGGLTSGATFRGYNSILSGPAGGVVGMARTAERAGFERIIGFDMGGTSTDITLYDRRFARRIANHIAGVRIQTPMLDVHTIAAGGGSCLRFADGRLQVGPESAGATPGPVAYRNGGPLAVTDIQACLGRLQPDFFPPVFGPCGTLALDTQGSTDAFAALCASMEDARDPPHLAEDFLQVAIDKMALAVRSACLSRGIDVDAFCLSSFGGAAGQHACAVAAALGLRRILISPFAGVLSALGMGLADHTALRLRAIRKVLDDTLCAELESDFAELEAQTLDALSRNPDARHERRCHLRYRGSDTTLEVPFGSPSLMRDAFEAAHAQRFGLCDDAQALVVESISVEAIVEGATLNDFGAHTVTDSAAPAAVRPVWFDRRWHDTPVYRRDQLGARQRIVGPALIVDDHATTVVEPTWHARLVEDQQLLLTRDNTRAPARSTQRHDRADPARLELYNNLFTYIAEQMGAVLQKTARSVNIKERLDFSCALFDADGRLLANAPHMPVHLGSMGESVRAVRNAFTKPVDGDSFVVNDPYAGGTHLPDITVVTPFFGPSSTPLFYLAARGHHADVGGTSPGSMPADSTQIEHEGILLAPRRLTLGGKFDETGLRDALAAGPYPARDPDQNIADLLAQLAANRFGASQLSIMLKEHGIDEPCAYAQFVQDNAALAVRDVVCSLSDGHCALEMDDGQRIEVRITVKGDRAHVDFSGTSAQLPSNFNAPAAVCRAAVLYAFRCLVARPIPMNAGCMAPIDLTIPDGSFLAPRPPAAVAAGNVETSMCITDALFGAMGKLASSQGTMNNVTFGNDRVQYYETLCGGAGAGDGFDGCSAIHTHMTNSRLTDPEILEARYPVRITRFEVRRGSGGRGRYRGGDGLIREYEFLESMTVSLLGNRRRIAPFGVHGGGNGACGVNTLLRVDGAAKVLGATAMVQVESGDRLRIETPGGGAYGRQ